MKVFILEHSESSVHPEGDLIWHEDRVLGVFSSQARAREAGDKILSLHRSGRWEGTTQAWHYARPGESELNARLGKRGWLSIYEFTVDAEFRVPWNLVRTER